MLVLMLLYPCNELAKNRNDCFSLPLSHLHVNERYSNTNNREVKHGVIGRRQTAKIASDFEFFSFVRK